MARARRTVNATRRRLFDRSEETSEGFVGRAPRVAGPSRQARVSDERKFRGRMRRESWTRTRTLAVAALAAVLLVAGGATPAPVARATISAPTPIDLGTLPGGTSSVARAVSDNGQVVGSSNTASGQTHAFSWTQAGGMVDLGTLPGASP